MSEAANPNMDSDVSASAESVLPVEGPTTPTTPPASAPAHLHDDGWQTVDFPGGISVDAIARATSAAPPPTDQPLTALVALLRKENTGLRKQISVLEQDLAQAQIDLQLEVARSLYQTPDPADGLEAGVDVHATLQDTIQTLAHELDLAQQLAQRQQILIETLTEQLESSQERIAQLERDCTLTQQRYNEQVQLLMQSENTCRDLRMRLHRQQQHALQFKAALEKCLEMPSVQRQNLAAAGETGATTDDATLLTPKTQPVQPWSVEVGAVEERFYSATADPSALPDLLSRLMGTEEAGINTPAPEMTSVESELTALSDPQQLSDLLSQIFPDVPGQAPPAAASGQATASVFDLGPFLEAGEVNGVGEWPQPSTASAPEGQSEKPADLADADAAALGESLWDDLARLLDPAKAAENAAIAPDLLIQAESMVAGTEPAFLEAAADPEPVVAEAPPTALDLPQPAQWVRAEAAPSVAQTELAEQLSQWMQTGAPAATVQAVATDPANPDAAVNWPSPVLYPLRPSRKLASMAAVDLPTFPRTAL